MAISDDVNSMFYGTTARVSGTSTPAYYWKRDSDGKHFEAEEIKDVQKVDPSDKSGQKRVAAYDVPSDNVYAPFALFNDYALMYYSGIGGFLYQSTDSSATVGDLYDDTKFARSGFAWATEEPTYTNIIQAYNSIEAGRYKIQDFIYNKYYNDIPPNYLITLRRYPAPCDDIPFTLSWDEEVHQAMYAKSVMPPMATATTYLSEAAGNKIDDILHMSWGTNWEEKTGQIQTIQSQTPGFTGFGLGQALFNKRGSSNPLVAGFASSGVNFFTGRNDSFAQQGTAEFYANVDPWAKYSNFSQGPTDVIDKTKVRGQGLNFSHDFALKFEYELKSLQYVNPKIAMLDIIANMICMGTNTGTFFGGATRYYGTGGGYGEQLGDPSLFAKGDYIGYAKSVTNKISDRLQTIKGDRSLSSMSDWLALAKSILTGAVQNMMGSLIDGKLGKIGAMAAPAALLSGNPTGYWHVTIGNPLNPILMMGNMICNNIEMSMGEGLGYDDFPTNVSFNVTVSHGKPRDAGDIESMFNAGKGRIYLSPYLGGEAAANVTGDRAARIRALNEALKNAHDPNHIDGIPKTRGGSSKYNAGNTGLKVVDKWLPTIVNLGR